SVLSRLVVIAKDVEYFLKSVISRFGVVASGGRGSRSVFFVRNAHEFLGDFLAFGRALLADFITGAPENDARVIAIAPKLRAPILLMPVVEQEMIVVLFLATFPTIERFIHHQKAHAVSQLKQLRRGWIVTGANGVDAHLFQNLELPLEGAQVER